MADQIKEISNGTYGIGALSNGVAIAGTGATTQYVVKDIQVQNNTLANVGAGLDFVVNGVNVAGIDTSVTGSEIIGVSSTAVAQATADFDTQGFDILFPSSTASAKIYTYSNKLVNENFSYAAATTESAAITTALSSGTIIRGYATIGSNFYYWIQSTTATAALYRRDGGINGTETIVPDISSSMPVVFDGVNKFYWVTTTAIYTHNATTNTNSFVSIIPDGNWSGAITAYPRISYANGFVFWTASTNGGNASQNGIFAMNPTTGNVLFIQRAVGTLGTVIGTETVLEVFYSNSTYYIVSTPLTTTIRDLFVRTIADFGPLTSTLQSKFATTVYTGLGRYTAETALDNSWPAVDMAAKKLMFMSSESNADDFLYVYKNFDPITQTFGSSLTVSLASADPRSATPVVVKLANYRLVDDSANKTNATFYPQTATLRVTGVETTL
jgi:hypothetical protein